MALLEQVQQRIEQAIHEAQLPDDFIDQVIQFYLPLAELIDGWSKRQNEPLLLSLQGPQGAGKSTLCHFLQLILEQQFNHTLAVLSLDDFYLTQAQRRDLAETIHPLLQTRGVPGTHDLPLALKTLESLQQGKTVALPRFNKAEDEPFDKSQWPMSAPNVSIILFEGWCNHAPVAVAEALKEPQNELERNEDPDAVWRTYVNDQLKHYHAHLFSRCDALICLRIPTFDLVYEWRGLQEQKLKQASKSGQGIMDEQAIRRFIDHFERISRCSMAALPDIADATLWLNEQHQLVNLTHKTGAG